MKRELYTGHSKALDKDMSTIIYGEKGYPVIVFQSQDSKCTCFEDFGMVDEIADYIDQGKIQLFSVDNNDEESWSATDADPSWRTQRLEDYFRFVTDELVPKVHEWNGSELRPLAIGCSMGGTLAAIAATRRPDLFQGNVSLSGVYRASFFFGDYMDERLYANDVEASLANMPADHPYVDILSHRTLVFCTGQGADEEGIDDLHSIDASLDRLGIDHWCDFWGFDVNHDWYWWKKQLRYFLPFVLEDVDRELAEEGKAAPAPAKKAPAKKAAKATPAAKASSKPAAAKPAAKASSEPVAKAAAKTTVTSAKKPAATAKKAAETKAPAKKAEAPKAAAASKPAAKKAEAQPKAAAKPEAKAVAAKKPSAAKTAKAEAPKAATKTTTATTKTEKKPAAAKAADSKTKTAAAKTSTAKAASATTSKATSSSAKSAAAEKKPAAKKAATTTAKPSSTKPAAKTATVRSARKGSSTSSRKRK